jgi:2-polyprenyl-3-methyl-5-hydroxy-6-metoxy-1,4-benzoquinol methylase
VRPYDDEAGDWRGLDSSTEGTRYGAIAEMLHNFGVDGSVLDVGCGEAVLRAWLPNDVSYIGIEPSAIAVQVALERNPSTKIIHTRAETFEALTERFDSIVFNEMLYYTADPVGLVRKYAPLLRHQGMILCSIYQKPGRVSLKSRLRHLLDRRRPISNVHCGEMVSAFMASETWSILEDRVVPIPGNNSTWRIWLAAPHP